MIGIILALDVGAQYPGHVQRRLQAGRRVEHDRRTGQECGGPHRAACGGGAARRQAHRGGCAGGCSAGTDGEVEAGVIRVVGVTEAGNPVPALARWLLGLGIAATLAARALQGGLTVRLLVNHSLYRSLFL